ncbi:MAG: hypothetical protein H6757_02420 [Candidatus Omnitrophica bacterium]|nr:hypothetical protein [Candidatus Omnitrophota bacterium]
MVNSRRGNDVLLCPFFLKYAQQLKSKRENIKFLPGVALGGYWY